ncbi:kinase-like domain-containing protein [Rhodocollybia butyracea]|uniref:cAMP-dependent protein kinase n=1 Tax=Rhodocollybia butyracea TaxID=206335 RepID=A0A9P5U6Z6_9AGAR|nr:kinase-like domain-containing protein [Rhodocollybia butyracea]
MERSILTELPWNPFICGLIGTFVDPLNLYYAFEFCPKNSLRDALDSRDIFQPNVAQFYFCGVVAGLAFLHDHDIVHRDLKPENVFLGPGGYPVIGDFGTARRISDDFVRLKRPRGQAEIEATDPAGYCDWREVGTFVYSAPEIYSAPNDTQYFGPSIDWWAAGIMLYEMLTRKYPFYSKNRKKMHAMIQRGKVKWPGNIVVGKTIKALVASLLAVDPMERMGTYGVQEVLDYPWFKNVDWVKIQSREYTCPVDKDVLGPGERWHRHPLPKREIVLGLNVVEPSLELRYDERFKYKEI